MTDKRPLEPFVDFLLLSLSQEWQRKTSLEVRAYAIVTANLSLATLFLAVTKSLALTRHFTEGASGSFALTALTLSALSVLLAIGSTVPRRLLAPDPVALARDLDRIVSSNATTDDALHETANSLIQQYEAALKSSRFRGWASLASFSALGLAAASLTVAAVLADAL